jgi:hypothetical protein
MPIRPIPLRKPATAASGWRRNDMFAPIMLRTVAVDEGIPR